MGLCDGVVSDDSDVWAFGVRVCYKNMFSRRAEIQEYDADVIREKLGLTRTEFVSIAMLSGGDYCHGFDGIGCVYAVKIINQIGGTENQSQDSDDEEELSEDQAFERVQSNTVFKNIVFRALND